MSVLNHQLTLTGATGLAAYGLAAATCGLVWARAKSFASDSRVAALATLLEGALLLDLIFSWRWKLHDLFAGEAMHLNLYSGRREPQALVLGLLAILIFGGLLWVSHVFRKRPGAFLAMTGILLSLLLWCTEVVSLHAVDHILYHAAGPVTVVGLLRLLTCLVTVAGVLLEL